MNIEEICSLIKLGGGGVGGGGGGSMWPVVNGLQYSQCPICSPPD